MLGGALFSRDASESGSCGSAALLVGFAPIAGAAGAPFAAPPAHANGLYPPDASAAAICCIWCGLNPAVAAAAAAVDTDDMAEFVVPPDPGAAWYCCIAAIAGAMTLSMAAQFGFATTPSGGRYPNPAGAGCATGAGATGHAALAAPVAVSDASGCAPGAPGITDAALVLESCVCNREGIVENALAVGLCRDVPLGACDAPGWGKKGLNPPLTAAKVCAAA